MKRLLAYLFLVLGLGLVLNFPVYSEIKMINKTDSEIKFYADKKVILSQGSTKKIATKHCNQFNKIAMEKSKDVKFEYYVAGQISKNKNQVRQLYRAGKITWENYVYTINNPKLIGATFIFECRKKQEIQIAKKEPSQTQEVGKKGNFFCIIKSLNKQNFVSIPIYKSKTFGYDLGNSVTNVKLEKILLHTKFPNPKNKKDILNYCDIKIYKSEYYNIYFSLMDHWSKTGGYSGSSLIAKKTLTKYLDNILYDKLIKDDETLIAKVEPSQTQEVAKKQGCIDGNCINGQGTYLFVDGNKYVGEFKDGKQYGQGTFTFAHGDKYVGEFKDGKMHGQGTYTFANGQIYNGIFEGSNFVKRNKVGISEEKKLAKKEPIIKTKKKVAKKKAKAKKELSTKVAKLTDNEKKDPSTNNKKLIRKKIKIDQNNQKVEQISAWEKSVLAAIEKEKNYQCEAYKKFDPKDFTENKIDIKKLFKRKICIKESDLLKLGTYKEFDNFPKAIVDTMTGCKSNHCIRKKAGKMVYNLFVQRGPEYHARHPGAMIKGMAWFEILYLDNLKKGAPYLKRHRKNAYNKITRVLQKGGDQKKISSLIKMNNGRIKMREALGFTLYDDTLTVINSEWLLSEFLDKDKLKVTKNILSPEMLKRKDLIERYKSVLAKYKAKLEEEKKKKNDKKS